MYAITQWQINKKQRSIKSYLIDNVFRWITLVKTPKTFQLSPLKSWIWMEYAIMFFRISLELIDVRFGYSVNMFPNCNGHVMFVYLLVCGSVSLRDLELTRACFVSWSIYRCQRLNLNQFTMKSAISTTFEHHRFFQTLVELLVLWWHHVLFSPKVILCKLGDHLFSMSTPFTREPNSNCTSNN